jgi:hypothetical protein
MLVSGHYFDYLAPDPSVIDLDVLEHGLHAPRFNNQTIRPITTQEHSMRVRRIVRDLGLSSAGMSDHATQRWALLHDAHEALVPWGDCLGPGKTPEMKAIEAEVDEAIIAALGVDEIVLRSGDDDAWILIMDTVRVADAIALYFEAMLWGGPGASDWAPLVWPKTHEITGGGERPRPSQAALIERFMPLIAPRPGESWRAEVEALLGE